MTTSSKKIGIFCAGVFLAILGVVVFNLSFPKFSQIAIIGNDSFGMQVTTAVSELPYKAPLRAGEYKFKMTLEPRSFFPMQKKFSILYDNCFVSVAIDHVVKYPRDFNYPSSQVCKYLIHKPLDLSPYLTSETKSITVTIKNEGGNITFGLGYALNDPVVLFSFILGILGLVTMGYAAKDYLRSRIKSNLKHEIKNMIADNLELLFLIACVVLGVAVRYGFRDLPSADFSSFLSDWYRSISEYGIDAYKYVFSDYLHLYLYLLLPFTWTAIKPLYVFKIISVAFDVILSVFVFRVLDQRGQRKEGFLAAGVCFLLPTIILNSSYWAQCDVTYTCFIVAALYYMAKQRYRASFILYGIACAIKLQSFFIFPLFAILWLRNKSMNFSLFLWIPFIYILSFLPSLLVGFPPQEILHAALHQIDTYKSLNSGSASLYALFSGMQYKTYFPFAMVMAVGIVGYVSLLIYRKLENTAVTSANIITYGLIISFTAAFFLPKMHERYFTIPEVMALLYVFTYKKRWYVLPLIMFASFNAYINWLSNTIIPLYVGSILNLIALTLLYKWHLTDDETKDVA